MVCGFYCNCRRHVDTKFLVPLILLLCLVITACSPVRHVPKDKFLLDKTSVSLPRDTDYKDLNREELETYIRQLPNHKLLWKVKMQLGIYNMSGRDSTKWYNRLLRNLGEAPVIYDSTLTRQSVIQLQRSLENRGYLHAKVYADTVFNTQKRKAKVDYRIVPGQQYHITSIDYEFADSALRPVVMRDSARWPVQPGSALDLNALDAQRTLITDRLRNRGFFTFQKNFITFNADTTAGSTSVGLTMRVAPPPGGAAHDTIEVDMSQPWYVRKITFVTDYEPVRGNISSDRYSDSINWKGYDIIYGSKRYLRPNVLVENCFMRPGGRWSARAINNTYEALSRLGILKFVNVQSVPTGFEIDGKQWLDVYILLTPGKSQTIALELEGTNSEGDLGVAASISYSHRNLGRGSEIFSAKIRGAYESLSGKLEGFIHNRYMEYSVDLGLTYPKFKAPFLTESFKRRIKATTEVNLALNYQERPEYTRVIATTGWSYKWMERRRRTSHIFTPIDIDYVYLPKSTINFIEDIAPNNPLLRYSYEDHFIMRLGYTFYHTNKVPEAMSPYLQVKQKNIYTIRAKGETAGNLLFGLSSLFSHGRDFHADPYKVFGIHYAQYVKLEGSYSFTHIFDQRNSLAFRAGLGVAIPYGNSKAIPFEKRFYGGGANGVRGWDVRTLGPGNFHGRNSVTDFMNQCGDINLLMSAEYRAKLFWVFELGVFVDAGNIWTIHNYENQPGGMFHFNSFYKEIAASYGLGLRMNFTYFLLRFDLGMKAHNPAEGTEPWPIIHPRWGRDRSFHFSVGYPF